MLYKGVGFDFHERERDDEYSVGYEHFWEGGILRESLAAHNK